MGLKSVGVILIVRGQNVKGFQMRVTILHIDAIKTYYNSNGRCRLGNDNLYMIIRFYGDLIETKNNCH